MPTTAERIDELNAEIAKAQSMARFGDRAVETDLAIKVAERDRLVRSLATKGSGGFRRVVFKSE